MAPLRVEQKNQGATPATFFPKQRLKPTPRSGFLKRSNAPESRSRAFRQWRISRRDRVIATVRRLLQTPNEYTSTPIFNCFRGDDSCYLQVSPYRRRRFCFVPTLFLRRRILSTPCVQIPNCAVCGRHDPVLCRLLRACVRFRRSRPPIIASLVPGRFAD